MTDSRNPDRLIQAFLSEGVDELSDHVYDSVRDQLHHNRQRVGIGPMRMPILTNNAVRLGIAAAAVVLVAFVGIRFLLWSTVGDPTATPTPTADASPMSSPSSSPAPSTTEYVSDPAFPIPLTFSIPPGWQVASGPAGTGMMAFTPGFGRSEIGFYVVDNLYVDACEPTLGWRDPPLGPTADDLVTALTDLPTYAGATISATEVDGYPATHLDRATAHATTSACNSSDVYGPIGLEPRDSVVGLLVLGRYPNVWVVDADEQRLLIVRPGSSAYGDAKRLEEMDAILTSLRIGP